MLVLSEIINNTSKVIKCLEIDQGLHLRAELVNSYKNNIII